MIWRIVEIAAIATTLLVAVVLAINGNYIASFYAFLCVVLLMRSKK